MGWLSDTFGGGDQAGKAEKKYQEYMQQALQMLRAHEATGRGDISGALTQALGFGAPYRGAGQEALGAYMAGMGLPTGQPGVAGAQQGAIDRFAATPGYKFALQQGLHAVGRQAAARGLAGSGAEQRELQRTGQGLAQREYGQYQSRLAGLAGMGQQEAGRAAQYAYGTGGELSQLGLGYAGLQTPLYGQMGQAAAEAEMAKQPGFGQKLLGGGLGGAVLGGLGGLFGGGGLGGVLGGALHSGLLGAAGAFL